jgi:phage terminase small subunit
MASTERTIDELVAIAFANMSDYVDWGPDGVKVKDLTLLTPAQRIAIAEVSETHIKLHDKVAALSELAKRLGMYGKLTRGRH